MPKQKKAAPSATATATALSATLQRWDEWLAEQPATVTRLLQAGAKPADLERTAKQIGTPLPASLTTLLSWRDGAAASTSLFAALFRQTFEGLAVLYDDHIKRVRFIGHRDIAHAGATPARLNPLGESVHQRAGSTLEAPNAVLVPFIWLPAPPLPGSQRGANDQEPGKVALPGDAKNDWLVAVDTKLESVWLFEVAGEELVALEPLAPSLATLFDAWLALLVAGRVRVRAPAPAVPRATAESDPLREAAGLLALLLEKGVVELAANAKKEEVARRLAEKVAGKARSRAIEGVVGFLGEEKAIEEVFVDDDVLRSMVEAFL